MLKRISLPCNHCFCTQWCRSFIRGRFYPESYMTIFATAARLHKVALYKVHGLGDFRLPRHVTYFAGCATDLHLKKHQFLEECHLDSSIVQHVDAISLPSLLSLLKLRRLYVDSTRLLRYLHLPSLRDLTLEPHVLSVLSMQST